MAGIEVQAGQVSGRIELLGSGSMNMIPGFLFLTGNFRS